MKRLLAAACANESGDANSLLDRAPERDVFPLGADRGLGFMAFSPLAGGWLTGKHQAGRPYPTGSRMTLRPEPYEHLLNDVTYRGLAALSEESRVRSIETSTLALAWALHHPQMTAAIVGPRCPEHLDPALATLDVALSPADATRLARLFAP
jgi:aryl-alcohol dehydrogenase-like predicted oxidoreductase